MEIGDNEDEVKIKPGATEIVNDSPDGAKKLAKRTLAYLNKGKKRCIELWGGEPAKDRALIRVSMFGTAGIRMHYEKAERVTEEGFWNLVYTAVTDRIKKESLSSTFVTKKEHYKTISGDEEAFYEFLCMNYIQRSVNRDRLRINDGAPGAEMTGLIEMGGASVQVAYANHNILNQTPIIPQADTDIPINLFQLHLRYFNSFAFQNQKKFRSRTPEICDDVTLEGVCCCCCSSCCCCIRCCHFHFFLTVKSLQFRYLVSSEAQYFMP